MRFAERCAARLLSQPAMEQVTYGRSMQTIVRASVSSQARRHARSRSLESRMADLERAKDRALEGTKPWQDAMKSARRAAYLTHIMTGVLEFIRFAPKGTQAVHTMLLKAAVNLEKGGDLGIFSPMYLIVMKKPVA